MSWQGWFTLAVVLFTVVVLARDLLAPAIAVLAADIVLLVSGVISANEAFSGFSNAAPITVAALYVVARAVEKTGALQPLVAGMLGEGGTGRRGLARLLIPTAGASAVLNNTPIVAMLVPQVSDWAERRGRPVSWYLMPLSFATILGGTLTVIGTSTNIVISGLLESAGYAPLGMFEITRIGLPVAVAGLLLLLLLAPLVLPDRRTARQQFQERVREFVVNMEVEPGGPLAGQTVEAGGLRHLQGVFLAEIQRGEQRIAPATPTTILQGGDRLVFVGRADLVVDLHGTRGLRSAEQHQAARFNQAGATFFEAVVSAASPLVGKTLRDVEFRSRYQAAVLAIHRAGAQVRAKLGTVRLKEGDTLLLLSDSGFYNRWRDHSDFLLVSRLGGGPPVSSRKAFLVGAITVGIIGFSAVGLLPILHAALLGALGLVLLRVLTPVEARRAIDFDVIVLIAASFGLGAAIESSGLAGLIGDGIIDVFSGLGPLGVLFAVAVVTVALTELITNNAAAVLLFPIALATAAEMGMDPRPFAIAVAVAASASFLTPIGYQTNTMVYGPGGYRFGDYARLGAPLTLVVIVTILVAIPFFWPLR